MLVVSDGQYGNHSIDRVYRINDLHETTIEEVRDVIYEYESAEHAEKASRFIKAAYGEGVVRRYTLADVRSYNELRQSVRGRKEGRYGRAHHRSYHFEQDGAGDTGSDAGNQHGDESVTTSTRHSIDAGSIADMIAEQVNARGNQAPPVTTGQNIGIVDPSLQQSIDVARRFGRAAYKWIVSGTAGTERVSRVQSKLRQGAVNMDDLAQGVRVASGISQYVMYDAAIDIDGNVIGDSFISR